MSKATASAKPALAAAAVPAGQQVLVGKEASTFKEVNRLYECRDFKKALRLCDDILKKVADHGETMALKAMCLHGSGKKEEALELSRRALKANMKSQVTWHVLGTMHRSDMNHREAMRCFLQALKWDKDNLNILRDLCTVQVHIGEHKMHSESRRQILQLNPKLRQNWHGFAVSLHLAGNHTEALRAICAYEDMCAGDLKSLKEKTESRDEKVEAVEAALYHCMLLEEGMGPQAALDYLHALKDSPSPSARALAAEPNVEVSEIVARLNLAAGHFDTARTMYSRLLFSSPECGEFHLKLMVCKGIINADCSVDAAVPPSAAQQIAIDNHLEACIGRLPPSATRFICRLRLGLLSGDLFRTRLDEYLQSGLHKGMPSLHQGIKPLYNSAERLPILSACIEDKLVYLRQHGRLPLDPDASHCSPDVFFWCMFMTAQHRLAVGRLEDALVMIVEATLHTPTVLDSYMVKARILKRLGDFSGAEAAAEEARCMDLADRFINTFSTRYQIKNGHYVAAEATLMLFCKSDEYGPALQTNWYHLKTGLAAYRDFDYAWALKKLTKVVDFFGEYLEELMDFHGYSIRRVCLRSYVKAVRFFAGCRETKYWTTAVAHIMRMLLTLHDHPDIRMQMSEDLELVGLNENQRAKALRRRKEAEEAAAAKAAKEKKQQVTFKSDDDANGRKALAALTNPLERATKISEAYLQFCPNDHEAYSLGARLAIRNKAPLRALYLLKQAVRLQPQISPSILLAYYELASLASTGTLTFSRPLAEDVFREQVGRSFLGSLPPLSADLGSIRAAIRSTFANVSIEFAMTVSEVDLAAGLEAATVMNSFALSCPIPVPIVGAPNVTKSVEVALAAYRWCQHLDKAASTVLAQRFRAAFPHSTAFSE